MCGYCVGEDFLVCNSVVVLKSLERALITTGLFIELPRGLEAQIRPRSGLAFKHGISIVNSKDNINTNFIYYKIRVLDFF